MKERNEIKKIIWWLFILCFVSTLGYIIVATPFTLVGILTSGNEKYVMSNNMYHFTMAIYRIIETCIFVYFIKKDTFKEFKSEKINKKIILPSSAFSVFCVSLFIVLDNPEPAIISFGYIFRMVLIVPVFEELMFRGAILKTAKKYGGSKFAILLSALLFAMYHMSFEQFILVIPLGLICGYIADKYSIKNSIIVHMIFNSVNIVNSIIPNTALFLLIISAIYSLFFIIKNKSNFIFSKVKCDKVLVRKTLLSIPMILFSIVWVLCIISDLS